ncbi:MAG TPA: phosphatase PAP2 family protein [Acidimicrobiales bacterium]|nr:phosphatase PAP2 family protein [Acidimicrobiales bacterium]
MIESGTEPRQSHRRLPRDRSRRHAVRSFGVAAIALLVTTLSALPKDVTAVERSLFYAVNGLSDAIEWPLWAVMQLGAALAIPAMTLAAFLGWRRMRPAVDVLAAGALAWLSARVMKDLFERGRPPSFFEDVKLRGSLGAGGDKGLGFPSGHATVAFALAIVVFPYVSLPWRIVTVVLATIVAFSRLYFGAHFPLDVLGGAALGVAIAASVHLVLDLLTHHH